jgi:hypothetical protein
MRVSDASGRFKRKKSSAQGGMKQVSKANVKDLAAAAALERQNKNITKQINPASRFLMVKRARKIVATLPLTNCT